MEERLITLDYAPRKQFQDFHNRTQRWALGVAHRRCGKTVANINDVVKRAIIENKERAKYAYFAPYREQAKQIAWDYLKFYSQPILAEDPRESELSVKLINGAVIRLYGADNPDASRGIYLDGVIFDEFADMRPSLWGEVIRPLLTDRKGWATFIGTPKGRNNFYEMYERARNSPDWFTFILKASETGILSADELASARKDMTQEQYDQEFECSFEAAILGAIYAKDINIAKAQGRIGRVAWEPQKLVNTAWDIGEGDSTAIWFWQWNGITPRVIDYYETHGEKVPHYAGVLKSKGYSYDTIYLPHDAEHKHADAQNTFAGQLRDMGFNVQVLSPGSLEQGINKARLFIAKAEIDAERCKAGLEALAYYRWDYNDRLAEYKTKPIHDWSSHGADAWRYMAMSSPAQAQKFKPLQYSNRGIV